MPGVLRIPLHSGSRLPLVSVPDGATLLAAPPPLDPLADVRAAVVEALRYPLSGPPLQAVAPRGGRATVVVQPPTVPLPSVEDDPRRDALAAVLDELARHGVPRERITVLVAGGLGRRAGRRELELFLRRDRARGFRGEIVLRDCEAKVLRTLTAAGRVHRINPALVETDLVLTVGAGETVLHGGAGALVDACAPGTIREAGAVSLLEATTASAWRLASALESAVGRDVPVLGLSVVLDHPRGRASTEGILGTATSAARLADRRSAACSTPHRHSSGGASSPGSTVSCGRSPFSPGRRASPMPRPSFAA